MGLFSHTVRQAGRRMLREWPFTLLVTLILALGIGSNTAIFSVLNAILIDPLPYPKPEELLTISSVLPGSDSGNTFVAALDFFDWQQQATTLQQISGYMLFTPVLTGDGDPENLNAAAVTPGFFSTLGVDPLLGRNFTADDGVLGRNNYAILTHGLWQRRFGGDPSALGKTLRLDDETYEIIGVAPPEHEIPSPRIQIYLPLAFAEEGYNRQSLVLTVLARRKPDVTLSEVRAEMEGIAGRLEQEFPETNGGRGVGVLGLHESRVGSARSMLLALQVAGAALLLMICVNVASLLLARALVREKERALRQAMGASSWTLIRESLVESSLFAILGGLVALPFGLFLMRALLAISPTQIPRIELTRLDGSVLLFSLFLTAIVAVLAGLLPAILSARRSLRGTFQGPSAFARRRGARIPLGSALVVAEVALALGLLVSAGLLLRSLSRIENEPKGFSTENVLVMQVSLPYTRYASKASVGGFFQELLPRLDALPGTESVGAVSSLPLQGGVGDANVQFFVEGRGEAAGNETRFPASLRIATPGYFRTLGIPLLAGRGLSEDDREDRPPIAVINQTMARRFWPTGEAIGKKIHVLLGAGKTCEIVGIVGDTRHDGLDRDPKPEFYWSYLQSATPFASMVLRTNTDPMKVVDSAKQAVWRQDPELAIYRVVTMDQLAQRSVEERRWNLRLLGAFSFAALFLTILGVYGVMSRSVVSRRREIGVRMALGANRGSVSGSVVNHAMRLTLAGLVLGILLAALASRLLASLLYDISPLDLPTVGVACLTLVATALVGSLFPAHRAARTDPAETLRANTL